MQISSIFAFKTYTNIEAFKLCFDIEDASILILAGPAREGLQQIAGCSSVTLVLSSDFSGDIFSPRGGRPAQAQAGGGAGTAEAAGGGGRRRRICIRGARRSSRSPCVEENTL